MIIKINFLLNKVILYFPLFIVFLHVYQQFMHYIPRPRSIYIYITTFHVSYSSIASFKHLLIRKYHISSSKRMGIKCLTTKLTQLISSPEIL